MNAAAVGHEFDYSDYAERSVRKPIFFLFGRFAIGAVLGIFLHLGRHLIDATTRLAIWHIAKSKNEMVKRAIAFEGVNTRIVSLLKKGEQLNLKPLNEDVFSDFHKAISKLIASSRELITDLQKANSSSRVAVALREFVDATIEFDNSVLHFEALLKASIASDFALNQLNLIDDKLHENLRNYGEIEFDAELEALATKAIARAKDRAVAESH